jgi:mannose-6-phosphate isomerase-like protein (cupin superfamily)
MRREELRFDDDFRVAAGNARSQVATMVLAAGESAGGPDNRHPGSDQWLYVVSGEGTATIDGETHRLHPGVAVLIERGEAHEIRSTGDGPLQTLNVYVPPAYDGSGEPLPGRGG